MVSDYCNVKTLLEQRERFRREDKGYADRELEAAWEKIEPQYGSKIDREANLQDLNPDANPVEYFMFQLALGMYPPPEVMRTIQAVFQAYFDGKGKLDLETAFFGPMKKAEGNYAYRKDHESFYQGLELYMRHYPGEGCPPKIQMIEEYVQEKGLDVEPESILRSLRRWKARKERLRSELKADS